MFHFRTSLRAEILKGKNSFAFWLAAVGTTCVLVVLWMLQLFGHAVVPTSESPWRAWIDAFYAGTDFILLPLFVIIIASLVAYQEHAGAMWKHLYALGVSRWDLYVSKLVYIALLFAAAHLYFIMGMLVAGLLTGLVRPESGLLHAWPDFGQVFALGFKTVVSMLGLLAIQYWISIRFRSFVVALGAGVIGFVAATLLAKSSALVLYFPYAYPLLYTRVYRGEFSALQWGPVSTVELLSLLYFAVFTVLGYWDVRRLDVR
ncbi:hypothetical protein SAMN05421823_10316 [Catalinimonas alkaloidigena]|uniref:ABC-2 family transporter protein n=1 Tax=Catalinimonas alkaloidigena TaxID=1075417 RepID=A0A1G9D5X9_9BACT|nr:ABC transporter permease [Catalinimonas alkaloidigena]SDK59328.1 hypothetical protein SAMN05421823_10316 [Catalinimonas alkaloidigena]